MTSPSHSSDEDFLASLGVSLEEANVTADADTHASVTGIYAQAEIGPLTARLQSWIQADPDFQRLDALSRRRVVLSHPVLRRYYLGERVDIQIRGCRSVPYSPPEDMISLMQPIGSQLDDFQRAVPSQPLSTRSSRASGPSTRTPRRRPMTDPTSCTPVEGPSRARPSRSAGPSRAPRAISEATGTLHPDLANLRLRYSIPYYLPNNPPAFREVSLESVDHSALPSEDITEVPVGLVNQMMELVLRMQQELTAAWTQLAFDDQRRRRPRH
ncbi:hypothetical protein JCGZ_26572 [Jatropha curcas]|uniref:Uncharacterized protein n=1 Tax=Jatropha curcas TaxID=180498 RepID=A0A067JXZ4_JATCU|nr:hypothetical protein JCGZ_26572 [Jatropha curcas]